MSDAGDGPSSSATKPQYRRLLRFDTYQVGMSWELSHCGAHAETPVRAEGRIRRLKICEVFKASHGEERGNPTFGRSTLSMADPNFQLLSAVRYDLTRPWKASTDTALSTSEKESQLSDAEREAQSSPIFLVSYHRDRLAQAADAFGWSEAAVRIRSSDMLERFHALAVEAIAKESGAAAVDADLNAPWKARFSP